MIINDTSFFFEKTTPCDVSLDIDLKYYKIYKKY